MFTHLTNYSAILFEKCALIFGAGIYIVAMIMIAIWLGEWVLETINQYK